jgi:hypothetical protein
MSIHVWLRRQFSFWRSLNEYEVEKLNYQLFMFIVSVDELIWLTFRDLILWVNVLLFLDLNLIMTNPFYPRQSREKWYFVSIGLFGLIWGGYIFIILNKYYQYGVSRYDFKFDSHFQETQKLVVFLIIAIQLVLVIKVAHKLSRKTSVDLRKKMFNRHLKYFGLYSFQIIVQILDLNEQKVKVWLVEGDSSDKKDKSTLWLKVILLTEYLFFAIPIILIAILRLSEPYVLQELKF